MLSYLLNKTLSLFIPFISPHLKDYNFQWKNEDSGYEKFWIFILYKRKYISLWNNIYDYSHFFKWIDVVEITLFWYKTTYVDGNRIKGNGLCSIEKYLWKRLGKYAMYNLK